MDLWFSRSTWIMSMHINSFASHSSRVCLTSVLQTEGSVNPRYNVCFKLWCNRPFFPLRVKQSGREWDEICVWLGVGWLLLLLLLGFHSLLRFRLREFGKPETWSRTMEDRCQMSIRFQDAPQRPRCAILIVFQYYYPIILNKEEMSREQIQDFYFNARSFCLNEFHLICFSSIYSTQVISPSSS